MLEYPLLGRGFTLSDTGICVSRCFIGLLPLMLVASCHLDESVNEIEFVALEQETTWGARLGFLINYGALIKKVHHPKITIDYGFSDNNHCQKQFTGQYEQQITDSISRSLTVWLAPLADQGQIVSKFEYRYQKTYPSFRNLLRFAIRREFIYPLWGVFGGKPDLSVIFYCQAGRSLAMISADSYATINMYQLGIEITNMKGVSDLKKYNLTTLHHEIGHAFGLGDTYVDNKKKASWRSRYNVSDGGDPRAVGTQPISVMSSADLIALDPAGKLQLGYDDIAGMKWLYNYYVAKTIRSRFCPADYRYESSTRGCTPRYPLIFAVKQNNHIIIKRLLLYGKPIDVNQQDELGNTALHYAASLQKIHGGIIYHYLTSKGADPYIKNNNGVTPYDLVSE